MVAASRFLFLSTIANTVKVVVPCPTRVLSGFGDVSFRLWFMYARTLFTHRILFS